MPEGRVGAYGLVPAGVAMEPEWWNLAPQDWVEWRVGWRPLPEAEPQAIETVPDSLVLLHQPDGFALIERSARRTTLYLAEPLTAAGLVHPYLGSTVVSLAHWMGWQTFHAGSVVLGGGVWGILGERERGKSTTVAWLAGHDFLIFGDDVLVVRDGRALAGPRAMDLRRSAAERFGMGESIGVLGTRERWRHRLPAVPAELPLAGFVALEWGVEPRLEEVPPAERLQRLGQAVGLSAEAGEARAWLELAALPMIVFRRPRRWDALDGAMERLVSALG